MDSTVNLEQNSELELVRRARSGDEPAFEEIVRRYSPRVFQIASRFFRRRSEVEEMAQEVFLKAYTQLSSYQERGSFEGWLSRITTNTCLNALRHAKRHPETVLSDLTEDEDKWLESKLAERSVDHRQSAEHHLIAADLAERVLGVLSPDDRLVLTLIDGDEFSVDEVAEMMGWSRSKVKVQAFRARRRMRKAVEKLLGRNRRKGGSLLGVKPDHEP